MTQKKNYFLTKDAVKIEKLPRGIHHWLSGPDTTGNEELLTVRVEVEPGNGHSFHCHPDMEEVIYVLSGKAEQWVEEESRVLTKDEAAYIPKDTVHATFNVGDELLTFLAILSPAKDMEGAGLVDVSEEEPWRSLRSGQ